MIMTRNCYIFLANLLGLLMGLAAMAPVWASRDTIARGNPAEFGSTLSDPGLLSGVSGNWLAAVQENIRQSEYNIRWQQRTPLQDALAAYEAPNRTHNLHTYFTPQGIHVLPQTPKAADRTPQTGWSWGLRLNRIGRPGALQPLSEPILAATRNRVEFRYNSITEWYVNDSRGLEQGFTLLAAASPSYRHQPLLLELTLLGGLIPNLTDDAQSVEFTTADGNKVLRYSDLHVYDAQGAELPARFEVATPDPFDSHHTASGYALHLTVVDTNATYPLTIDPLVTSPSWTAESDQADASFGTSVGTAGDVNGDGFADVIVSAPDYNNSLNNQGRVYVYHGSATGLNLTPAWMAESDQANSDFGVSVGTAGDVNGDGYDDVIIGAPRYDNGQINEGRVYVYHGSATGLNLTPAWTAESDQANSSFGASVGTAGDVNGDGYDDVIIGAPKYGNGQDNEGRAYVYHGSSTGLSASPAWKTESNQAYAEFGTSVSTAGDVNGDGYDDVIIGAPEYDKGQTNEGRVYVYHGSNTGLSATPTWKTENNQANSGFGWSVGTAGDINDDGYDDIIIGAPDYDNGQENEGRAYVYHGSATGPNPTPAWTAESNQAYAGFGWSVGTAGDVNRDGYDDVIIGAPLYDNVQDNEGRVYVYHGSDTGLSASPAWTAESDQALPYFGVSVSAAGDVNDDGFADVIVGAPSYDNGQNNEGSAFLYDSTPTYSLTVSKTGGGIGTVTSVPEGIECGTDCEEPYAPDTSVTLTAVPAPKSTFEGWSGACLGTDPCLVTMTQDTTVTATFTPFPIYLLSVTRVGDGGGTVTSEPAGIDCGTDCAEPYSMDTSVTLTATPDSGSGFAGWSGVCTGIGSCVVSMTEAKMVTATFNTCCGNVPLGEALDNSALAWTTGGPAYWFGQTTVFYNGGDAAQSGQISHSQTSMLKTTVTGPGTLSFYWKVDSEPNYDFLKFFIDEEEQAKISGAVDWQRISFQIPSGVHTLKWLYSKDEGVNFGADMAWLDKVVFGSGTPTYTLSVSMIGSGIISSDPPGINCGADCKKTYTDGTVVTLTAKPAAAFLFSGWSGDADCNDGQVTMNDSHSCTATFLPDADSDGDPDVTDPDDDNDGVPDELDSDPLDPSYRGAESGHSIINHIWTPVDLPTQFRNPVVIAGPPTYHDTQPGVVRLRNVSSDGFAARFQEWDYEDGAHSDEEMSYLVIEAGRRTLPDGSIWEAGTFSLNGTGVWKGLSFTQSFSRPPQLFLTLQTNNDTQAATVRARNVTASGFEAALFEQQSWMTSGGHGAEQVGYLAIHSWRGSGEVNLVGKNLPYLLQKTGIDERWTPVLTSALHFQEEQSQDLETNHDNETIAVLALGPQLFAQDISSKDFDPGTLRRLPPPSNIPLEWGSVSGVPGNKWVTIPLAKNYINPVIVAKVAQQRDAGLGVVRLRNANPTSFQARFQEWNYLDGKHNGERIFFLVAEQGQFNLAGLKGEAGRLLSNQLLVNGSTTVAFDQAFTEPPALFTSVMTHNNSDVVTTRVEDLDNTGFGVAMQEQENKNDGHPPEVLGWISIEQGTGLTGDGRRVEVTETSTSDIPAMVIFNQTLHRRFPVLLQDLSSSNDSDTAIAAQINLSPSKVEVYVQEEQSADAEVTHASETISVFAAE